MKRAHVLIALALAVPSALPAAADDGTSPGDAGTSDGGTPTGRETFTSRVVTAGLEAPFELTWGPDGMLWLTERTGKRVSRIDPTTGTRTPLITIDEVHQSAGQDGLLGLALHPELLQGKGHDYVYVAFTYDADPGADLARRTKLRRYTYDASTATLGAPVDLITGLPASNDHNAGRVVFGPDQKIYYTIGEGGANQFENKCNPIRAQELPTQAQVDANDHSSYWGKSLRMNLDGSIPDDNPVIGGVRSHVFTYGHRNPQGLVFGPGGKLYSSEQGPKTDDEINLLAGGKNYGWPHVAGYRDDQAYAYANWSASAPTPCADLEFSDFVVPESVPVQRETEWSHPDFTPPLRTFFTVSNDTSFQDPACDPQYYLCWPTTAPASIDVYSHRATGIPGWSDSLLVSSLKDGAVWRVKLAPDGASVVGKPLAYFKTVNRYRDTAIKPDGRTFYVITDPSGGTKKPGGGFTTELENPGALLEYTYVPPTPTPGQGHGGCGGTLEDIAEQAGF